MRRRLVLSTILVVTIAIIVLAVPVTLIVRQAATAELEARTTQEVQAVAAFLTPALSDGSTIDLDTIDGLVAAGDGVRVLDEFGATIAERDVANIASPFRTTVSGPNDTRIQIVASSATADEQFRTQLFRLAVVALAAIAVAAMLAFVQARRFALPLERLARSATRLGEGDFTVTGPTQSGIEEIDGISRALRLSGNRVERMLDSERGFTADATHQLRTGLTGLAMRLEILERHPDNEVSVEAGATLTQIHELNSTLDELLRVARKGSTGERTELDLVSLVDHHVTDWQERFAKKRRQVVVTSGITVPVIGTPGLIGQVLNVLMENSLVHGRGTVAILVQGTSVTIEDEGNGIDAGRSETLFDRPSDHQAAHGRGLALARRLAQADGGRLELIELKPATFMLSLLPSQS